MLRPLVGVTHTTHAHSEMRGRTIKFEDRNKSTYILNSMCADAHPPTEAKNACFSF